MKTSPFIAWFFILWFAGLIGACGQEGPIPGDIYREYGISLRNLGNSWRITDPDARFDAQKFLPNPKLKLEIGDLEGAVRAEALIDVWGGHAGTTGKKFRFNGGEWIEVPAVPTIESNPECYVSQYNVILDLPLEMLHKGENIFEGTSGGQTCYDFNWGQWGWWVMLVRVYYGPEKVHSVAQLADIVPGDSLREFPLISIQPQDSSEIARVDFLAKYNGYDENGDGVYNDWHRAYHSTKITGHLGTAHEAPWEIRWDTRWIPDQEPQGISLVARIMNPAGIWYVSEITDSLTLVREEDQSVYMYTAENIPEKFVIRSGATRACAVHVDSIGSVYAARLVQRTWNAGDDNASSGTVSHSLRVNNAPYKCYGKNHDFAYSEIDLSVEDLKSGRNVIKYVSDTEHHGIEVLWPGPGLILRKSPSAEGLPAPAIDPPSGSLEQGTLVMLIDTLPGVRTFYTVDGTNPNPSRSLFPPEGLTVDRSLTLMARSFKEDFKESEVSRAVYTLNTSVQGQKAAEEAVRIYPNPTRGSFGISAPDVLEIHTVKVFTEQGELAGIYHQDPNLLSITLPASGTYLIWLEGNRGIVLRKLLVY